MSNRRALVVASDEYVDPALRALAAPRRDATDLAEVLTDPKIGGFEVASVINRPHHEVQRAIARFFSLSQRSDTLLFYFSGHGVKDENGLLYFAMSDTERDLLSATSVPSTFVSGQLEQARADTKIVILDCCFGGAFSRAFTAKADMTIDIAEELRGIGRVVITASSAMQYSFELSTLEGPESRSLFTKHLVHGLRTGDADTDGDGQVTVDELYRYVHDEVVRESPNQRPTISSEVQGRVLVGLSPRGVLPILLPVELRAAIASPLARVRRGAVEELADLRDRGQVAAMLAAKAALEQLVNDDSAIVARAASTSLLPTTLRALVASPSAHLRVSAVKDVTVLLGVDDLTIVAAARVVLTGLMSDPDVEVSELARLAVHSPGQMSFPSSAELPAAECSTPLGGTTDVMDRSAEPEPRQAEDEFNPPSNETAKTIVEPSNAMSRHDPRPINAVGLSLDDRATIWAVLGSLSFSVGGLVTIMEGLVGNYDRAWKIGVGTVAIVALLAGLAIRASRAEK